jgi:Uma2 family endonuclease
MLAETLLVRRDEIVYPESDGLPMADNTKQGRWIVVLFGNLAALFHPRGDVFVTLNVFWYPVEGDPEARAAPDVLVVFGRPKGDRSSYKQWKEEDVPVTVAFEVLSPGNSVPEMIDKHLFYEEHGVEEYYIYDPDNNRLFVYVRQGGVLRSRKANGFVSPRMGIRFDLSGEEMVVYRPDGRPFLTFEELEEERARVERSAVDANQRAEEAEQRADQAERRADTAEQRAARLAQLSRKARLGQLGAEELQELERLETEAFPPG